MKTQSQVYSKLLFSSASSIVKCESKKNQLSEFINKPLKIGGYSDKQTTQIEINFMRPYFSNYMETKNAPTQNKIDFNIQPSITYWCNLLQCEKEDLLYAIRSVGNSYEVVNSFLILNRRKLN